MTPRQAIIGLGVTSCLLAPACAVASGPMSSVLVLHAQPQVVHAVAEADEGIRATLSASTSPIVRIYTEYLDTSARPEGEADVALSVFLRRKYEAIRPDLVIAGAGPALRFAVRHRPDLFPDVPIVFFAVNRRVHDEAAGATDVTGVWLATDAGATLDAALALQPGTRRVFVASGTSALDLLNRDEIRRGLARHAGRVDVADLPALSLDAMARHAAELPPDAILLVGSMLRDGAGHVMVPSEAAARLAHAASVPTYALFDGHVGRGPVGGRVVSFRNQGRMAADLALGLLRGDVAMAAVRSGEEANAWAFDWRALRRWELDPLRLPAGSEIRYRVPAPWEPYRWHIAGGAALLVLQTGLIAGLLIHRARRQRAERTLAERVSFEGLLAELSGAFNAGAAPTLDPAVQRALGRMVQALEVDRVTLAEVDPPADGGVSVTHVSTAAGIPGLPARLSPAQFPWTAARLSRGEIVHFERVAELPAEAAADRRGYAHLGTRSFIAVPLVAGGDVIGALTLSTMVGQRTWPAELLDRLPLMAEIFASALLRRRAEAALQERKLLGAAIFTSLYGRVAALDRDGVIIAVNDAWGRHAAEEGAHLVRAAPGASYVDECRRAGETGDAQARPALEAIEAVLSGRRAQASVEYACGPASDRRWFQMFVEPLRRPEGGAVVSHVDVTDRRRAEDEARQRREELAHALRLSTTGELAASLAHEINQPLLAIMSNAQAADRLLDGSVPDLSEARAALKDIAGDAHRAAEVIRALRAMVGKYAGPHADLDVNELVARVGRLVRHDVERREVALRVDLDGAVPPVRGDAVQLQQVVLNLLVNASDAVAGAAGPREIDLVTSRTEGGEARIEVVDSGPGVPDDQLHRLFSPFFTSKPHGLGLGLSISRSIVEAHGGRIEAVRNPGRGLAVRVVLPATAHLASA